MVDERNLEELVAPALAWYDRNRRDLPWRRDHDAYHVWVSEIMLQQTRVEAVKPYYERFLATLPTIQDLAECPEDQLLKLWEGLGYYSRVRNLQKAAQVIMEDYDGQMPETFDEIIKLPGIGTYTAGAIASIAFGENVPAVDGNVLRLLARVCEDDIDIKSDLAKKRAFTALVPAMKELPKTNAEILGRAADDDQNEGQRKEKNEERGRLSEHPSGNFNQAMMDLGATICIPNGAPLCNQCPWNHLCQAYKHDKTDVLPVRSKGKPRRIEERTILLVRQGDSVLLHKRPDKGLLAGLYEPINLKEHLSEEDVEEYLTKLGYKIRRIKPLDDAKHIFSHIEWRMKGYQVTIESMEADQSQAKKSKIKEEYFEVSLAELADQYAIPSAFEAYAKFLRKS